MNAIHMGNVLLVAATIPSVASVIVFSWVPWWRSQWGRHLWCYMVAIAAAFLLGCAKLAFGDSPGFQAARGITFGALVLVLWWRLLIIVQAHLEGPPDDTASNVTSNHRSTKMNGTVISTQVVSAAEDALSRAVRQGIQALIPTLLILAGGSTTGLDVPRVLLLAGVTMLVSVLRSVTDWRVPDSASLGLRILDRAAVAAAGAALGFWSVDALTTGTAIPWHAGLVAAAGAGVSAVAMMFTNKPPVVEAVTVGPVDDSRLPGLDGDF